MKQKINLRLIAISVLAVLATVLSITVVYYELFQEQVKKDLRTEASILSAAGLSGLTEKEDIVNNKEIRITWISDTGEVLFDNDASNLDNHLNRPEVQEMGATGAFLGFVAGLFLKLFCCGALATIFVVAVT